MNLTEKRKQNPPPPPPFSGPTESMLQYVDLANLINRLTTLQHKLHEEAIQRKKIEGDYTVSVVITFIPACY